MSNILNLVKMSFTNLNSMKKVLFLSVGIFSVASLYDPTFLNLLIGLFVYTTLYQVMAYEDMYDINKLIGYLPVTRREYIASRYVLGLANILIGIVVYTVIYMISTSIGNGNVENINYKVMLMTGITSAILLLSVSIPIVIKVGVIKGRILCTIVTLSIVMVPAFVINDLIDVGALSEILRLINSNGITMILSGVSLFIMFVSYSISNKIFYKKNI